ncbi:uncharacterized protein LOC126999404 isoform X2 [Eriocheir sinensis]|uniref:uncharacterized protein LOC126999404 isoform X2 n=1 Tax=Eriocheir sinensis TaxID=95602 RepID=UPI0021C9DAED|nr:uncharacterized protein LOC126999404 isoform X2 [Eriocheir sinensis]
MESLRLLLLLGLAAFTPMSVSKEGIDTVSTNTTATPAAAETSAAPTTAETSAAPTTAETSAKPLACPTNFLPVGDRCVLVNPFTDGSWVEAGFYCNTFGSNFLQIETWQFYLALLNFLRSEGLDQSSYWLGARDEDDEGTWRWELSGEELPMGSPWWALDFYYGTTYNIEPMGLNATNCLRLDHKRYLYLDDDDCENNNAILCQVIP